MLAIKRFIKDLFTKPEKENSMVGMIVVNSYYIYIILLIVSTFQYIYNMINLQDRLQLTGYFIMIIVFYTVIFRFDAIKKAIVQNSKKK